MKLDKLFEKFLSLFKKETSESAESDSTSMRRSRSDRKKIGHVGPIRKFWRRYHLTKIVLIIGLSTGLLVGTYLFAIAKSTNVNDLQNALKTRTLIFDREEKEAGALSGQKGTYVELTDISKDLQNAVVATEDRSFYKNDGINYGRFFLAIVTAGRSGGGSTITQQLAKNAYLSQDQTVERKAKEFFLALELTKKYSKEQILTMYLNNAYFGNGVWGVEDASKKYFGVSAAELSLDQAATLAGMLKGPELYNPLNSIEDSTNRRDTVLQNMVAAGYINKNQETEAAGVDMASQLQDKYEGKISDYRYPSYFDAVVNEAVSKYNLTEEEIVNNGYRIYTELDQNYQANMQVIYENTALFPTAEDGTHAESGSVALEPKTGGVRGVVGRVAGDKRHGQAQQQRQAHAPGREPERHQCRLDKARDDFLHIGPIHAADSRRLHMRKTMKRTA